MRHLNALTIRLAVALGGLTLIAFALTAGPPAAAEPEKGNLDVELQKHADQIIKYLREQKKYKNVGVLKFLVKQGDAPASDNLGPLNLSVADRLEVALVLANPNEKLGIIERASAAVAGAKNPRASHLTPQGRAELFEVRKYALAWGSPKETVQADAFLTGTVKVSPDGRTLTVNVEAFDRDSKAPEPVCTITAATDFRTLAETGRSYQLIPRGPKVSQLKAPPEPQTTAGLLAAINDTQEVRTNPKLHPLEAGNSPVELRVLYNGLPQKIKGGEVEEPQKGQEVHFVLINKGTERYGVVLKVNGENTLFQERYDALQCHRWILDPREEVKIGGFQTRKDKLKEFEVLSAEESKEGEVNYGEHAGTFSMVVFRKAKADHKTFPVKQEIAAIASGSLPPNGEKPGSLAALKGKLLGQGGQATEGRKGVIVPGKDRPHEIRYIDDFKPDPEPVLAATVRYRKPASDKVAQ